MESRDIRKKFIEWIRRIKETIRLNSTSSSNRLKSISPNRSRIERRRTLKWKRMLRRCLVDSYIDIKLLRAQPKFHNRVSKGIPQVWRSLVWLSLVIGRQPDSHQLDLYEVGGDIYFNGRIVLQDTEGKGTNRSCLIEFA
jgi:hypothetical protein